MKIRIIKPCSEARERIIIEGEIDLKISMEEIYRRLKKLKFSKMIFLPTLRTMWVSVNSIKIILFESGRIIVSRCETKEEGESLIMMIENIQRCTYEESYGNNISIGH